MTRVCLDVFESQSWIAPQQKETLWELILPFAPPATDFDHPLFKVRCRSAIENLESFLKQHETNTKGVIFSHFSQFQKRLLAKSCYQEQILEEEGGGFHDLQKTLFVYEQFYQHCKELYSWFDQEWNCYIDLDFSKIPLLEQIYVISPERVEPFSLVLKNHLLSARSPEAFLGILVPDLSVLTHDCADQLIKVVKQCNQYGIGYRLLPENFLYEHWDGVDELIVLDGKRTENGLRGIAGFKASMGKMIGVEGFEPPTYCSQSSRANQAALHPERN